MGLVNIDGSFNCDLPENPVNKIFVSSFFNLTKNFGLDTVAECVETLDAADICKTRHLASPASDRRGCTQLISLMTRSFQ